MPRGGEEPRSGPGARVGNDGIRPFDAVWALRHRSSRRRRSRAWPLLAVALATLVAGMVVAEGLLIAAGPAMAGVAGHLLDL